MNGEPSNAPAPLATETSLDIPIEDEVAGREKMLEHLPKMYELMLDIPDTHRERMLRVLRVMTEGLP
jgi:hypothetical protein